MAKGDGVKIVVATPDSTYETGITASKAGRRLRLTRATRGKVQWVDIAEVNRNGKETGDILSVRQDAILTMFERKAEEGD